MSSDKAIPVRPATATKKWSLTAPETQGTRDFSAAIEGSATRPLPSGPGQARPLPRGADAAGPSSGTASRRSPPRNARAAGPPIIKVKFSRQQSEGVADAARKRIQESRQILLDGQALSDFRQASKPRKEVSLIAQAQESDSEIVSAEDNASDRSSPQKTRTQPKRAVNNPEREVLGHHHQHQTRNKQKRVEKPERDVHGQQHTTSGAGPSKKRKEKDPKEEQDRKVKQQESLQRYFKNVCDSNSDPQARIENFKKDMAPLLKVPQTDPFYGLWCREPIKQITRCIEKEKAKLKAMREAEPKKELVRVSIVPIGSSVHVYSGGTGLNGQQRAHMYTGAPAASNAHLKPRISPLAGGTGQSPSHVVSTEQQTAHMYAAPAGGAALNAPPMPELIPHAAARGQVSGRTAAAEQQSPHMYAGDSEALARGCRLFGARLTPGLQQAPELQQMSGAQQMPGPQQIAELQWMAGQQQIPGLRRMSDSQQMPGPQRMSGQQQTPRFQHIPRLEQIPEFQDVSVAIGQSQRRNIARSGGTGTSIPQQSSVTFPEQSDHAVNAGGGGAGQPTHGRTELQAATFAPSLEHQYMPSAGSDRTWGWPESRHKIIAPESSGQEYVYSAGSGGAGVGGATIPPQPLVPATPYASFITNETRRNTRHSAGDTWTAAQMSGDILATSEAAKFWYAADCAGTGYAAPPRPTTQTGTFATSATQQRYAHAAGNVDARRSVPSAPAEPSGFGMDPGRFAPGQSQYGHGHAAGTDNVGRIVPPTQKGPQMHDMDPRRLAPGQSSYGGGLTASGGADARSVPPTPAGPPLLGIEASRLAPNQNQHEHVHAAGRGAAVRNFPPTLAGPPVLGIDASTFAPDQSWHGHGQAGGGASGKDPPTLTPPPVLGVDPSRFELGQSLHRHASGSGDAGRDAASNPPWPSSLGPDPRIFLPIPRLARSASGSGSSGRAAPNYRISGGPTITTGHEPGPRAPIKSHWRESAGGSIEGPHRESIGQARGPGG
jgi:hypothetical protein